MTVPPRRPALTFVCALFVFIAALGMRYWYLDAHGFLNASGQAVWQVQGQEVVVKPPTTTALDQLVYNLMTQGFPAGLRTIQPFGPKAANGEPVDEPLADRGPLYPLFQYGIRWVQNEYVKESMTPHNAVRIVQLVLGALTCVLYFAITLRGFGNHYPLALLVGLATAAYPFWVMNVAELEDGTFASFLLALSLAFGVKIGQKGGAIRSYVFGVSLAALALTRAALLPFTIVLHLWLFLRCRRVPHGGLCAIVTVLGFASGLAPWLLWTTQTHGEPLPIASSSWFHLWVGNNELADGNQYQWSMAKRLPTELVTKMEQTPLPHRYDLLAPVVVQEVTDNPMETVRRRLKAFSQFFFGMSDSRQPIFYPAQTPIPAPSYLRPLLILTLFGMFLFALLGWRWSYGWKYLTAPLSLAVFWIPIPYILSHAGPLHSARLPLDGIFLVLAVVGFVGLLPAFGARLVAGEDRPAAV